MTLRRQLYIAITALFILLIMTDLAMHFFSMRKQSHADMLVRAKSVVTAVHQLGDQDDPATVMSNRISVWFESHYFRDITYRNLSGDIVVHRENELDTDGAPNWFVQLLSLPQARYGSDVLVGDKPIGSIEVTVQPTTAYENLWSFFCQQLLLFVIFIALTFWLSGWALNWLLKPLKNIEKQANSIRERHFVECTDLPTTREMRSVAETMNCMSRRLKIVFEEQLALTENLRAQSYLDSVTGLSNRREFNARMQSLSENEAGDGGCLFLLQVDDFSRYNLKQGHESGDECLRVIAAHLQTITAETPDAIVSRRAGADFAVFLPRTNHEHAKLIAEQLIGRVGGLDVLCGHRVHIGIAGCAILRADHRLLAEADLALRQAQSQSQSGWKLYQEGDVLQVAREARQWYATLNRVLQERSLMLHFQPMFHVDHDTTQICEVFCRITMHKQIVSAGIFLPMAERFGLAVSFDRMILEEIQRYAEQQKGVMNFCVNLSPQTLLHHEFLGWLDKWLAERPAFSSRLIVETSEYLVRTGGSQVDQLCKLLHRHKVKLSLDHFGVHSGAFGYLRSLPLNFLKIDRSFIRGIHEDKDNQFYVQSMIQIAHSCDVTVFAEGVELQEEWECLQSLGIDGGQGYFLGRPNAELSSVRTVVPADN
jgi:diguanylate cyclase (GGDEF)-like protein